MTRIKHPDELDFPEFVMKLVGNFGAHLGRELKALRQRAGEADSKAIERLIKLSYSFKTQAEDACRDVEADWLPSDWESDWEAIVEAQAAVLSDPYRAPMLPVSGLEDEPQGAADMPSEQKPPRLNQEASGTVDDEMSPGDGAVTELIVTSDRGTTESAEAGAPVGTVVIPTNVLVQSFAVLTPRFRASERGLVFLGAHRYRSGEMFVSNVYGFRNRSTRAKYEFEASRHDLSRAHYLYQVSGLSIVGMVHGRPEAETAFTPPTEEELNLLEAYQTEGTLLGFLVNERGVFRVFTTQRMVRLLLTGSGAEVVDREQMLVHLMPEAMVYSRQFVGRDIPRHTDS